ncbi:hypothetical protein Mterra_00891 [Calidithermus terrae]|uniref:Uncharacterized protein n=1 Tax=Calidithermus terrae TaxID=1408545 RepID=A0A399EZ26_9DEIN|nr:hypothetical protein Mterra_00891 [Calidithermus terrae]
MAAKVRERKSDRGTRGLGTRAIQKGKASVASAPSPSATNAPGSRQPCSCPRMAPKASPPTASATISEPVQSKRPALEPPLSGTARSA